MKIKIKKLHPNAHLPTYATPGSACFDLVAQQIEYKGDHQAICHTHLAFEVPPGFYLELHSRSGHGIKHRITLSNGTGIVDSDYRGEVIVCLDCPTPGLLQEIIKPGDRVAQGKITPVYQVAFDEAQELSDTQRGNGGFGSTGR